MRSRPLVVHASLLLLITGDPLAAQVPLFRTTDPVSARHGVSLDGLGDVNGNGFGDVAVGEPIDFGAAPTFPLEGGAVWIYDGVPTGGATTSACGPGAGGPNVGAAGTVINAIYGPNAFDHLGAMVLGPGDVTGDGVPDLLVTAIESDTIGTSVRNGRVMLYSGATLGSPAPTPVATISGGVTPTSFSIQSAGFGTELEPIGDWTGDGIDEVLIGAPLGHNIPLGIERHGYVEVYDLTTSPPTALLRLDGPDYNSWFGQAATGLGDLTGDGVPEFAVGAPFFFSPATPFGNAYVYEGGSGLLLADLGSVASDGELFGDAMTSLDANGDGVLDLAVGQPGFAGVGFGRVRVLDGASLATGGVVELDVWRPGFDVIQAILPQFLFDSFGASLDNMGDLSGDGIDDVIVGTHDGSNWDPDNPAGFFWPDQAEWSDSGAAYLISGATGNVLKIYSEACGSIPFPFNSFDAMGSAVTNAGDLDGDGRDDVGIGSPFSDYGGVVDSGVARFYSGDYRVGQNYGDVNPNSTGATALISATGSTSISENDLTLICTGLPANGLGQFFLGTIPNTPPYPTFYKGFMLIDGSGGVDSAAAAEPVADRHSDPAARLHQAVRGGGGRPG